MPTYKLFYFDVEGRAELARYMFEIARVEYEDKRISETEWPEFKKTCEQGQMPILQVNGERFPQTMAIVRYLAREFGLYGSSNLEATRIDVVLETAIGVHEAGVGFFFKEPDAKRKADLLEQFKEQSLPMWIRIFSTLLEKNQNGDGFFVGNKISAADLTVFNILNDFLPKIGFPNSEVASPNLEAFLDRIRCIPEIAAWIKKRPQNCPI